MAKMDNIYEALCKDGRIVMLVSKENKRKFGDICQIAFNYRYYKAKKYHVEPDIKKNCSKALWEKFFQGYYYDKEDK